MASPIGSGFTSLFLNLQSAAERELAARGAEEGVATPTPLTTAIPVLQEEGVRVTAKGDTIAITRAAPSPAAVSDTLGFWQHDRTGQVVVGAVSRPPDTSPFWTWSATRPVTPNPSPAALGEDDPSLTTSKPSVAVRLTLTVVAVVVVAAVLFLAPKGGP